MKRRWTINGRFLTQPVTGVQRYAREIVAALDRLVGEGHDLATSLDLELAIPPGAEPPPLAHIAVRRVGRLSGHVWEQIELPASLSGGLLNLCNTGPVVLRRQVVCIHDLNSKVCPESYSFPFKLFYSLLTPRLGRRAMTIATVSKHSGEELVRAGLAGPDRIVVIPNGYEHTLAWSGELSPAAQAASGPSTIVLLGSPAPHKNVRMILGLADRLAASGFSIAVVGESNPAIFANAGLPLPNPNVAYLGRLSDGELKALLQASLCLAFPSLTEGFGLPPLEAMALGCPVVVSDRASLPEVCGDAALYASPHDPEHWLDRFKQLRDSPDLQADLRRRGRIRAACFSWRRSGELYLETLARADESALARALTRLPLGAPPGLASADTWLSVVQGPC